VVDVVVVLEVVVELDDVGLLVATGSVPRLSGTGFEAAPHALAKSAPSRSAKSRHGRSFDIHLRR
jgi:hypothetical protein